jgi:hypothetical protein
MTIENEDQLEKLRSSSASWWPAPWRRWAEALEPGMTTKELDDFGRGDAGEGRRRARRRS